MNSITVRQLASNSSGFKEGIAESFNHILMHVDLSTTNPSLSNYPISLEASVAWALDVLNGQIVSDSGLIWEANDVGVFEYSNLGFMLAGASLAQIATQDYDYEGYLLDLVDLAGTSSIAPIYEPMTPRDNRYQVVRSLKRSYLSMSKHPYRPEGADESPLFDFSDVPYFTSESSKRDTLPWAQNVNTLDQGSSPEMPSTTGVGRYGGKIAMPNGPLAAGGWSGNVVDMALFLRAFTPNDENQLLSPEAATQIWDPTAGLDPTIKAFTGSRYGLGVYLYKNWMMGAGGNDGGMSLVIHNLEHDVSYAVACNVQGNGFAEFVLRSALDSFENDSQGEALHECVDWNEMTHPDLVGPTTVDFDECNDFN